MRGEAGAVRVRFFSCRASLLSALSATAVAGARDFRPRTTASRGALDVFRFLGRLEVFSSANGTRRPEAKSARVVRRESLPTMFLRAHRARHVPRAWQSTLSTQRRKKFGV